MITFCQIWRRDFFHFLWAYYVSYIYACVNVMKTWIMLHVLIWVKHLFLKWQWPKKGHAHKYLCSFGPFLAVFGRNHLLHVPKMNILVSKINGLLILGHASAHWRRLHPLKTTKHLFLKQECLKKGHAYAPLAPVAPPENGDSFKFKIRTPVFWTIN